MVYIFSLYKYRNLYLWQYLIDFVMCITYYYVVPTYNNNSNILIFRYFTLLHEIINIKIP